MDDKELKIGLALFRIASKLDDDSFETVKDDLKEIELLVMEMAKEKGEAN